VIDFIDFMLIKYAQDIRKGMLYFLREEILDGDNAYRCQRYFRFDIKNLKYLY
jgi:hypothetical protein